MPRNNEFITEVEKRIARKANEARLMAGWSNETLAGYLGVSHQQAKKYMDGSNRITAGRLFFMAKALELPISDFFEETKGSRELPLKLARLYSKLNSKQKEHVIGIIENIVKTTGE